MLKFEGTLGLGTIDWEVPESIFEEGAIVVAVAGPRDLMGTEFIEPLAIFVAE